MINIPLPYAILLFMLGVFIGDYLGFKQGIVIGKMKGVLEKYDRIIAMWDEANIAVKQLREEAKKLKNELERKDQNPDTTQV